MINRWAKAAARAAAILGVLTLTGCGLALAADTLSLDQPTSGRLEAGDETLESGNTPTPMRSRVRPGRVM